MEPAIKSAKSLSLSLPSDASLFERTCYTFASNFKIEAKENAFYGLVLKIDSKLRDSN